MDISYKKKLSYSTIGGVYYKITKYSRTFYENYWILINYCVNLKKSYENKPQLGPVILP